MKSIYTATPKIGFPHYTRGGLLQLFRKVPFGWEDLGKVKERAIRHNCCGEKVRVGKENTKLFRFCPRCLVKTFKS